MTENYISLEYQNIPVILPRPYRNKINCNVGHIEELREWSNIKAPVLEHAKEVIHQATIVDFDSARD